MELIALSIAFLTTLATTYMLLSAKMQLLMVKKPKPIILTGKSMSTSART